MLKYLNYSIFVHNKEFHNFFVLSFDNDNKYLDCTVNVHVKFDENMNFSA